MPVGLGGPDADAVGLACELLGHKKGDLYIVYAIEVDRSLPVDAEIGDDFVKGEALLKRMEEVSKPYGCRTQADILQSRRAGLAAVQEAFDKKVDAIVLGIDYKETHGSFSLGETVLYILKNAPCRVIMWRDSTPTVAGSDNGRWASTSDR